MEEGGATGNLRQPGFQTKTLGDIDAAKSKLVEQLLSELGIGKAQSVLDVTGRNREMAFNKGRTAAGILQGGQQFADTLGFSREKFGAENVLNKRGQDLDELFRRDALSESIRRRDDLKPGFIDKRGQ